MIGVYAPGGRNYPHVDCYGLVKHYYKNFHGVEILDFDYIDPDERENTKYFHQQMNSDNWIKVNPQEGAVVALMVNGIVSHCGFMKSKNDFVHIMKDCGESRVKITNPKWKNRIVGYYLYA